MGLNLSSFFQYGSMTKDGAEANNQVSKQVVVSDAAKNYHSISEIKNLLPGQTFRGDVIAINGNEVEIQIDKDAVITAKLDRSLQIILGQSMTFEVRSSSDSQIALRPLFENLANDPNILKAIETSNIPMNNTSVEMVNALMEEGMPIDKQTLQTIYKQVVGNQSVDITTIAQMNRLQIPVTAENIEQFESYKNMEHSILKGINQIVNSIPMVFMDLLSENKEVEAISFYQKVIAQITDSQKQGLAVLPEVAINQENRIPDLNNKEVIENGLKQNIITTDTTGIGKQVESVLPFSNLEMEQLQNSKINENSSNQEILLLQETSDETKAQTIGDIQKGLTGEQTNSFGKILESLSVDQNTIKSFLNGTMPTEEFLMLVSMASKNPTESIVNELKNLYSSKEFTNILKNEFMKNLLIPPEDVSKGGKVEELYERIREQISKLTQSMSGVLKEDNTFFKTTANVQNNLDFMTQLNHLFSYVQLPLKMAKEHAHGDLYVYTNKKNLAKKDGNVSALLHLEMDHLGTMDIYVSMEKEKVSTKFYLEKEEYLDLIAKHIPLLNQRLEKRGYDMTSEVLLKEKKVSVMEEMLQKEKGSSTSGSKSKFSFDVRA